MGRSEDPRPAGDHAGSQPVSWHHGLVARWWAEFNEPAPGEVAYLRSAIERFGQPALDLGCGSGRLLAPLLEAGFDVDGVDVSADMVEHARRAASAVNANPTLAVQAMHELDLPRRYRTIFVIGSFELAGGRDLGRETLRRAHAHLQPGGALLINHELPYEGFDEPRWGLWLRGRRDGLPRPWPAEGRRRRSADGDELELATRLVALDPLAQRETYEMRAWLWRDGAIAAEETRQLTQDLYFAQEVAGLLRETAFEDVSIESGYTGRPATPDDGVVTFVARKPS